MKRKRAIVSVINDLVTDRRVDKTCRVLVDLDFDVLLVGRVLPDSPPLLPRPYQMNRMRLIFRKGPLFYAEYNIRLFFLLLFRKAHLLFSNDLDTLLPNYLISRLRRIPLVYDSHEYFTGTPELVHRPLVRSIWKMIEKSILPRLGEMITVNESIADLFRQEYGIEVKVVRNIPPLYTPAVIKSREELDLPVDRPVILLQGSGINIHRGAEEAVQAMAYIDHALLLIIGGGDVMPVLKKMSRELNLTSKVKFLPRLPFEELFQYTSRCDLGLTLDKDNNLNYRYSLPNKLFDYIHAGLPVLATPLPEVKKIIEQYKVGEFVDQVTPENLARKILSLLQDREKLKKYRENCFLAREQIHWGHEKLILLQILKKYA